METGYKINNLLTDEKSEKSTNKKTKRRDNQEI